MAEENYQKIKLLKIMEILRQETDEDHPMTKAELSARLESMNVSSSVRSLSRDIKLLNEQGYEIMEQLIGHEKGYAPLFFLSNSKPFGFEFVVTGEFCGKAPRMWVLDFCI